MTEKLAQQEAERERIFREQEEKRLMQQRLLEAEERLQAEKKRIEEMEKKRSLMDMEAQIDEERKKMEKYLGEMEESTKNYAPPPSQPPPSTPNPPDMEIVKQRRLSSFINEMDLPAPPSSPPKLPPPPKEVPKQFPAAAPLPPPIADEIPPPPSDLPSVPPPSKAPPAKPNLPAAVPPPPLPAVSRFSHKFEVEEELRKLSSKIDLSFNHFLQVPSLLLVLLFHLKQTHPNFRPDVKGILITLLKKSRKLQRELRSFLPLPPPPFQFLACNQN